MDLDASLALQISLADYWEVDVVDHVESQWQPPVIVRRIATVQSSTEKLDIGTDKCPAIMRRFIDDGVITSDGERLIDWLEAGPSSPEVVPRSSRQCQALLLKRIDALPDEIRSIYDVDHPDFLTVLRNLLTLCHQDCTGSQALRYLGQTRGKLASQNWPDENTVPIPPVPSWSLAVLGSRGGLSGEPPDLPDDISVLTEMLSNRGARERFEHQDRIGSRAVRYLAQSRGKRAYQDLPDRHTTVISPVRSFSGADSDFDYESDLSDELSDLPSQISMMTKIQSNDEARRRLDCIKRSPVSLSGRGTCEFKLDD